MGRSQVTVRLSDDRIEDLDKEADERGVNRADVIREALDSRSEHGDLQREVDRLRAELRATNARQDDVGELVEYVEEERVIQRRREERQREREAANILRKTWWAIAGRPTGDD